MKTKINHIKGKKGLFTFNMVYMIPRLIFLIIVLFSVIMLVGMFLKIHADTFYVEADLFAQSLIYSPHGISYYNPLLYKVQPGIIDKTEFTSGIIESRINNNSFYYGKQNKHIAAKITLTSVDNSTNHTIYYNEGRGKAYGYKFWNPIAKAEIEGKGAARYLLKIIPTLIKESSGHNVIYIPGSISFEITMPNK